MNEFKFEPYIKRTNVRDIPISFRLLHFGLKIGQIVHPKGVEDFVRKRFFTPSTKSVTATQQLWLDRAQEAQIRIGDMTVRAWKVGEGPSVLFAHGWNGRGVQFHSFFQETLDRGYSVVFFDAPAHGASDGEMTNYLEISAAIEPLLDHPICANVVGAVGHSLGTSALINHLTRHRSEIPLVLIAPPFHLIELLFDTFQKHGIPKRTYLKLVHEVGERFKIPLETQNPVDLIKQLENRILIVHDRRDKTTPAAASAEVAFRLKNVTLFLTDGFGHNQILKQKQVVSKAMDFLAFRHPVYPKAPAAQTIGA